LGLGLSPKDIGDVTGIAKSILHKGLGNGLFLVEGFRRLDGVN